MFHLFPLGALLLSGDGAILDANPAACRNSGYEPRELTERNVRDLVPAEDREKVEEALERLRRGEDLPGPVRVVHADGSVHWKEVYGAALGAGRGKFLLVIKDISTEVEARHSLEISEGRLRLILANTTDISFRMEAEKGYTFVSPAVEHILGYPPEAYYRDPLFHRRITLRGDLDKIERIFSSLGARERPPERVVVKQVHRDGRVVYLDYSLTFEVDESGKVVAFEGLARDVTARTLAEKELKRRETIFRTIYHSAPVMIMAFDEGGGILLWNRECREKIGWSSDEIMNSDDPLGQLFSDTETRDRFFEHALLGEGTYSRWEVRTRAGEKRLQDWASFKLESGNIVSVGVDMTDYETANEAIRRSELKLRQIIDLVPHFIFAKDDSGKILTANRAMADFHGTTVEAMLGKTDADFYPAELARAFHEQDLDVIRRGRPRLIPEETVVDHNGRDRVFQTIKIPFTSTGTPRPSVLGVAMDITERKRMEEELIRTSKIETIGLMAGGIAHDFNNILTGIAGQISLAKMRAGGNQEIIQKLERAERGIRQARNLTRELLSFSRGETPNLVPVDLAAVIRENLDIALSGSEVVSRIEIDPELKPVLGDRGQLGQVIHNLAINAKQAMKGRGTLVLRAGNVTVRDGKIPGLGAGEYVCLTSSDTGPGISPAHLEKMFEPFYTTKRTGAGLGLAVVNSIVRKHQGAIVASSIPGKGATFTVYLPASDAPPPGEGEHPVTPGCGSGRILHVDDEPEVREGVREMLELLGYRVSSAESGERGIELYREARKQGDPYVAVLLDLVMPDGIGGKETARALRKENPDACLIAASGFSNDTAIVDPRGNGFDASLSKPFMLGELNRVIERACAGRQAPPEGAETNP